MEKQFNNWLTARVGRGGAESYESSYKHARPTSHEVAFLVREGRVTTDNTEPAQVGWRFWLWWVFASSAGGAVDYSISVTLKPTRTLFPNSHSKRGPPQKTAH